MEDTPLLRQWIDRKVRKYSKQIGIPEPILVYNYKEMIEKGYKPDASDKRLMSTKVGNTWIHMRSKKPTIMHINIKHHDDKEELENTIAHELLHIRFPIMNHGEDFWTRLGMVLMGKKYGKVKKK
jgi:predicted metal-dependent hydrolase